MSEPRNYAVFLKKEKSLPDFNSDLLALGLTYARANQGRSGLVVSVRMTPRERAEVVKLPYVGRVFDDMSV